MIEVSKLFTGVGIIIDNKLSSDDGDKIVPIVSFLENECHIPLVKYNSVPDVEITEHFGSINFVILDWNMEDVPVGVQLPQEVSHDNMIEFLKKLQDRCFAPILLFSNEDINGIKSVIGRHGVRKLPILFKSKSELFDHTGKPLFWDVLSEWIDANSGLYVMKDWIRSLDRARVDFLVTLNKENKHWPKAIVEASNKDSTDPSEELHDLIVQNLLSRIQSVNFDIDRINKDPEQANPQEVLRVLEYQRFNPSISGNSYDTTGDFYEKDGHCFINIRPACDCVPREGFDGYLFLLECIPHGKCEGFNLEYGNYSERDNESILGPINGCHFYSVSFKRFSIEKVESFHDFRKGRVLHPFITRVSQKFGLFLQRQGLPRIPSNIFLANELDELRKKNN